MSGDTASSTLAKNKYEQRKNNLTDYEKRIGLPKFSEKEKECDYLNITSEDIMKFTPEQCYGIALDLANYALYIQRILSRESSMLKWLNSRIDLEIASELNNYNGYYSHSQRRAVAIVNNTYAKELEEMRISTQLKVDMLDGLTYQINQLNRVLLEARADKRYQHQR